MSLLEVVDRVNQENQMPIGGLGKFLLQISTMWERLPYPIRLLKKNPGSNVKIALAKVALLMPASDSQRYYAQDFAEPQEVMDFLRDLSNFILYPRRHCGPHRKTSKLEQGRPGPYKRRRSGTSLERRNGSQKGQRSRNNIGGGNADEDGWSN